MNESHLRNVIEAALLAAGKSLQPAELVELFDEGARPQVQEIQAALATLTAEYSDRGIEIKETAAGFRIQVRRELANEISRLWPERPARYSRALLETLALIAYRQPITRGEIEAVRGVAVNPNILKTVIERNWVRVVGHRDVPGRPELLGTTRDFLDYFGLKNLDELPPLAELKAISEIKLQFDLPDPGPLALEGRGVAPDRDVAAPPAGTSADAATPDASIEAAAGAASADDFAGGDPAASAGHDGPVPGVVTAANAAVQSDGATNGDAGAADHAAAVANAAPRSDDASRAGRGGTDANGLAHNDAVAGTNAASQSDGATDADAGTTDGAVAASKAPSQSGDVTRADRGGAGADRVARKRAARASGGAPDSALQEAEDFVASLDADLAADDGGGDDDGSDDDELSAAGPGSSELVAGPRDLDD